MRNILQTVISLGLAHFVRGHLDLNVGLTLDTPSTGISTTPDGRLFVLYARFSDGSTGPQLVEKKPGADADIPYPNKEWNSFAPGNDPSQHFMRLNAHRIGPDGALWIVDTGSPDFGKPVTLPDGPKLIKVDLKKDAVSRVYPLGNVSRPNSLIDDVRFNPVSKKAYLTDAGSPGLIILDLENGDSRRVLDDDISTRGYMPISADGTLMRGPDDKPVYIYADQLEVSPDARWLYYQPCSGGLSRIETKYMDEALTNSSLRQELGKYVEPYAHTASTGGTAIDADGNIYISDTDRLTIQKIAPNGTITTLIQDPRLVWADAMWIDAHGRLWIPSAQLNRAIPFNKGVNRIVKPIQVYNVEIGVGPSPIDHA